MVPGLSDSTGVQKKPVSIDRDKQVWRIWRDLFRPRVAWLPSQRVVATTEGKGALPEAGAGAQPGGTRKEGNLAFEGYPCWYHVVLPWGRRLGLKGNNLRGSFQDKPM